MVNPRGGAGGGVKKFFNKNEREQKASFFSTVWTLRNLTLIGKKFRGINIQCICNLVLKHCFHGIFEKKWWKQISAISPLCMSVSNWRESLLRKFNSFTGRHLIIKICCFENCKKIAEQKSSSKLSSLCTVIYRISAITTRPLLEPEPQIVPEF